MICPSTPRTSGIARGLWYGRSQFNESLRAATTDYNASEGYIEGTRCVAGSWGEVIKGNIGDPLTLRKLRFTDITDGLSKTTLVLERAALPDHYFDGGLKFEPHQPPQFRTWGNVGLWAISAEMLLNHLERSAGMPIVNYDNLHGLYSFHPGGALVAMGDGRVIFIEQTIDTEVMLAMISRNEGEVIGW